MIKLTLKADNFEDFITIEGHDLKADDFKGKDDKEKCDIQERTYKAIKEAGSILGSLYVEKVRAD